MALLAQYSTGEADDEVWLSYFICYGTITVLETLLTDGLFSLLLSADHISKVDNAVKLVKLPFLLWCMHPMTLGSDVLSRNVLGNLVKSYKVEKGNMAIFFNVVVSGAVLYLVYLVFFEKSLSVSSLPMWQRVLFEMAYPLIGSIYSLNTKGDLSDDNF